MPQAALRGGRDRKRKEVEAPCMEQCNSERVALPHEDIGNEPFVWMTTRSGPGYLRRRTHSQHQTPIPKQGSAVFSLDLSSVLSFSCTRYGLYILVVVGREDACYGNSEFPQFWLEEQNLRDEVKVVDQWQPVMLFNCSASSLNEASTAHSLWDRLPYELGLFIIDLVLAPSPSRVRLRLKVCETSSVWMRFVLSHPHYWTHVIVTSRLSRQDVRRHISLASPLDLHLHLLFVSSPLPAGLGYLLVHLPSVSHFTVETDNADTVERLHAVFSAAPAPRLRSFRILFNRSSISPPAPFDHVNPMPWFGVIYPNLQSLHLRCACVPLWPASIASLRELSLVGRLFPCRILATVLSDVITGCPLLESLTLFRVSCYGIDDDDDTSSLPIVHSASIVSLRLGFGGQFSLRDFVQRLDLPSLSVLGLDILSESDVADSLSLPPRLTAPVTTLVVRGSSAFLLYSPFDLPADILLPLFPLLTSLDLTATTSPTFDALLSASVRHLHSAGANLVPRLTSLSVGEATLEGLQQFVRLFSPSPCSGIRLQRLQGAMRGAGPQSFEDYERRVWLDSAVAHFSYSYLPM
ncbi:hypothetical protein C8F04DRAFT_1179574 [Mycena alexandri]|uniref:F-box domain-containing protein n=1 Tax=Mycena alexandri TaxID=1745969 RepID=A0AAD6T4Z8_9AGAR|nr:hypothetical protein C8F04DRAFT_1179574 [Mycena alexandri]